ncbi:lipase family protein [Sorangium sp. So ce1504]|uniref:lipase family protein n=1 Tax=Sorangium sp. So ce1504 TaxID=3133337 RepID=UPI003F60E0C8
MEFTCARGPDAKGSTEHFKGLGRQFEIDFENILQHEIASDTELVEHLVNNTRRYDQKAAALLSAASTWAYSDADTMARMMCLRGIPNNETVSMHLKNDALFLDTTVHVIQSQCGELVIVCFGGTLPTNTIQLLLDASVKADPFFSTGIVHGGIFRAFLGLWPGIRVQLKGALLGYSNCFINAINEISHRDYTDLKPLDLKSLTMENSTLPGAEDGCPATVGRAKMKALYLTGHSLGGALAVLATAAMHMDPVLAPIRDRLCGVYTFGQPMVGDEVFAKAFGSMFGDRLFRHVYRNDLVPHLPPQTVGRFTHFGQEYTSPLATWEFRNTRASQTWLGLYALAIGAAAWIKDQFPLLSKVSLPYSLGDHSPLNYLRTSLQSFPGAEFLP